ncbi:MAG: hypothetical protein ACK59Y_13045 [Betaproteobacteria bacterium]|nr:hypothetical protein [Betaproteobacteria bacterium]
MGCLKKSIANYPTAHVAMQTSLNKISLLINGLYRIHLLHRDAGNLTGIKHGRAAARDTGFMPAIRPVHAIGG